jgi:hypothetical protein
MKRIDGYIRLRQKMELEKGAIAKRQNLKTT